MEEDNLVFTVKDVLSFINRMIEFPYPQVCKHYVVLELLNLLEVKGWDRTEDLTELAKLASNGEDEKLLKFLRGKYSL